MTDTWYYADNGRTVGPFTLQDLRATLSEFPSWKDLPVWRDGFSEWQKAGGIEELTGPTVAPPATNESQAQDPPRTWPIGKVLGGIGVLLAVVIGAAFGKAISRAAYDFVARPSAATITKGLEERLAKSLAPFEATLPRKIDDLTTLVSARNEGTKMIFGNRLETDGGKIDDDMKARLREVVTKNVCADKQSRDILDSGGSYRFVYTDINTKPVTTVDIVRSDCS
jgi:hypothetical protein